MSKNKGIMHKLILLPFFLLIFLSFSSTTWSSILVHDHSESSKSHFVLVHGACLGAWSWYKVTTLLQSAGHNVTALDMAAAGINMIEAESLTSLTEYFQPLLSFMEALPSDKNIVLVGHSLGGLGISMAMERFPEKISAAIFVTAAMPGPLVKFSSIEEQDVTLASTLVRPQAMFSIVESMKELELTRDRYGSVKRAFIISEMDQMTTKIMVWAMLILNKPDRVGEVKGSDHMVMASKPLELSQLLSTIAQEFASSSSSSSSSSYI